MALHGNGGHIFHSNTPATSAQPAINMFCVCLCEFRGALCPTERKKCALHIIIKMKLICVLPRSNSIIFPHNVERAPDKKCAPATSTRYFYEKKAEFSFVPRASQEEKCVPTRDSNRGRVVQFICVVACNHFSFRCNSTRAQNALKPCTKMPQMNGDDLNAPQRRSYGYLPARRPIRSQLNDDIYLIWMLFCISVCARTQTSTIPQWNY